MSAHEAHLSSNETSYTGPLQAGDGGVFFAGVYGQTAALN